MIEKEIMYGVRCNRCKECHESSEGYMFFSDECSAVEDALEDGWVELNGKHYCPSCYKNKDDGEDEFEILSPIPQSVWNARSFLAACYKHGPNSVDFCEDDKDYILKMFLPDKNSVPDFVREGLDCILGDECGVYYEPMTGYNDRVVVRIEKVLANK